MPPITMPTARECTAKECSRRMLDTAPGLCDSDLRNDPQNIFVDAFYTRNKVNALITSTRAPERDFLKCRLCQTIYIGGQRTFQRPQSILGHPVGLAEISPPMSQIRISENAAWCVVTRRMTSAEGTPSEPRTRPLVLCPLSTGSNIVSPVASCSHSVSNYRESAAPGPAGGLPVR